MAPGAQKAAIARVALLLLLAVAAVAAGAAARTPAAEEAPVQPRNEDGTFRNLDPETPHGLGDFLRWRWQRLTGDGPVGGGEPAPAVRPDPEALRTPPGPGQGARLTWLGHASWLVQLEGRSFLIDPVLSRTVGGVVTRRLPPPLPAAELPPIDAVLVSHAHYDHLDRPTLRQVGAPVVAGLGTERLLRGDPFPTTPLGWWQSIRVGDVRITFVPAQHFSQRGVGDRNEQLWGGFVLEGGSATVYHSGDTAWFSGFREIGARFRIDAALLPIGAYAPRWFMAAVHVDPEDALRAFGDLGARTFLAMHWGTFSLADEPLDEPPRRLEAERVRLGLDAERVRVLAVGETVEVRREARARPAGAAGSGGAAAAP